MDKGETDYGNSRHQSLFKSSPQQIGSFANGFSALRISRLRALIPACFTIFCLYAGYRFYHFYLWTIDRSETYVSRPPSVEAFLFSPYNLVSDAKMLLFSLEPSSLTVAIMGFLLLISLVIRNFWCRCLCAYGALLGFLAIFSPMQVSRKASLCIDCKKCENICPASIRITRSETLRYPECIGCMECVEVCPQKGCLSFQAPRKKLIPISIVPIAILVLLGLFFVTAMLTGHWRTAMPPDVTKSLYQSAGTFALP